MAGVAMRRLQSESAAVPQSVTVITCLTLHLTLMLLVANLANTK